MDYVHQAYHTTNTSTTNTTNTSITILAKVEVSEYICRVFIFLMIFHGGDDGEMRYDFHGDCPVHGINASFLGNRCGEFGGEFLGPSATPQRAISDQDSM